MNIRLETLWQDLRYAVRQYRRTPVLVAVAVLSLAMGIGANTAVFTLINAVMLQWLPVADPARLVLFYDGISTGTYSGTSFHGDIFSYASWLGLRAIAADAADVGGGQTQRWRIGVVQLVNEVADVIGDEDVADAVYRDAKVITESAAQGKDGGVAGRHNLLHCTVFGLFGLR